MHYRYENVSVSMRLLFIYANAIAYHATFGLSNYNLTNVSVLCEHICIEMQPFRAGSQQIDF